MVYVQFPSNVQNPSALAILCAGLLCEKKYNCASHKSDGHFATKTCKNFQRPFLFLFPVPGKFKISIFPAGQKCLVRSRPVAHTLRCKLYLFPLCIKFMLPEIFEQHDFPRVVYPHNVAPHRPRGYERSWCRRFVRCFQHYFDFGSFDQSLSQYV